MAAEPATLEEIRQIARREGIQRADTMTKDELLDAIHEQRKSMNKVSIKLSRGENRIIVDGVDLTNVVSGIRLEAHAGKPSLVFIVLSDQIEVTADVEAMVEKLKPADPKIRDVTD